MIGHPFQTVIFTLVQKHELSNEKTGPDFF